MTYFGFILSNVITLWLFLEFFNINDAQRYIVMIQNINKQWIDYFHNIIAWKMQMKLSSINSTVIVYLL